MTDIRARLADVLREHVLHYGSCLSCDTSVKFQSRHQYLHQADVLLSLPDIAIVELPVADGESRFWYRGDQWLRPADTDDLIMTKQETTFGDAQECRDLAAALLAAANAAKAK